jgi:glycosyltransferase involved in cell wall biosynthesis
MKDLYLALSKGENFGWGVCSNYLYQETPKFYPNVKKWDFERDGASVKKVEGKVFHALTGIDFQPLAKIWGDENYGYTFFENELNIHSIRNARKYDKVIGGSKWNYEKLLEVGIENSDYLIQGIDPEIFYPVEPKLDENLFVIFSGGKFELRKGQDLVLRAFKALREKYKDIVLINAWYNFWPQSMELYHYAPTFNYENKGETWQEKMNHIYAINGIGAENIITLEVVPNRKLREIYAKTDIGLFPNRCEGGTNLVLMEYMACGKPVVAAYNSGQRDVLDENHALLVKEHKPFKLYADDKTLWANWFEPDLDEIIAQIEYAYHHRDEIRQLGKRAGEFMKNFTWEKSAQRLVELVGD